MLFLAGCTYQQTVSSYAKIDPNAKTVAVNMADSGNIHQDLKQALAEAGFKVNGEYDGVSRYKLVDDIQTDDSLRCGLFGDGYAYNITLRDFNTNKEVFGIEGKGCRENILEDFTALINNRYDEKKDNSNEPKDDDAMKAPSLKSGNITFWGN